MDNSGIPGLAEKLTYLFGVMKRPDGEGPYTNEAMAAACAERDAPVNALHISKLRNGHRTNPSAKLLRAIADTFGVPVEYFFDAEVEARVNQEIQALTQFKAVAGLRLRGDLDTDAMYELLRMITSIQQNPAPDA